MLGSPDRGKPTSFVTSYVLERLKKKVLFIVVSDSCLVGNMFPVNQLQLIKMCELLKWRLICMIRAVKILVLDSTLGVS